MKNAIFTSSSRIVIFIVVIVLAVAAGDVALWRSVRRGLYRDAVSELSTVSDLKRQHLEFWLADRREGMRVALPLVAKGLVTAPDGSLTLNAAAAEELRHQLPMDEWADACVITRSGGVVWSAFGRDHESHPLLSRLMDGANRNEIVVSGVHHDGNALSIDIVGRVRDDVYLLAAIDGTNSYMGIVESWPTTRETADAVLVNREGNAVEYLTLPRSNPARAGQLLPLTLAGPVINAALNHAASPIEASDERGTPTIAYTRRIAGTSWILITRIDRDEVFRPLWQSYLFILMNLAMVAVVSVLGVLLWTLRKRERTIADNAHWLQRLFEDSPAAIGASLHDRLTRVNPAYARLFRYSEQEMIGLPVASLVAPEALAVFRQELSEADLDKGATIETTGRKADGTEFPMRVTIATFRDEQEVGRTAFIEDLTDEKRAAALLEQSRDHYRRLLDHLPNPVWRADASGKCIYVSPSWVEFTGRKFEDALGNGWRGSIHPDDVEAYSEQFARLSKGRGAFSLEHRRLHRSGEYRWVVSHCVPFTEADGSFGGYLGSYADIHDLRVAQEQFRSLVEHAVDLITIVDAEGRIVYQNPRCESVLGYRPEEVIGTPLAAFVHENDLEGLFERVRQAPYGAPFRVRHKDGSYREVESMATRMPGADWRLMVTSRDITERRALEATAASNERMNALGRVAANVAHEFNNVMQSITPFTAAIERQANGQASVIDAARQIHRAVRRGREITQEILRFSRPEPPERQPLELRTWLAEVRETIAAYAGPKIDVRLECAYPALAVSADATQLHQAVTNLAVNACHAMPDGGVLTLRAEQSSGHSGPSVTISVSDTGSGIAPDVLPHIFEPMFTTKRSRGTGLGLPITQQIVARHGGTITVETAAGAGSTFRIQLPAGSPGVAAAEVSVPQRPTALVVEDDPTVAMAIEALLDLDGFQVVNVATAGRAIDAAAQCRPDLVVLDVGLPDMPGTELFGRLRRLHENLPIVFSTGHAEREVKALTAGKANVTCLVKPYGYEALSQAVRDVGVAA